MQTGKIFDLLVIGGGINGTGIAMDAASRGFSVVLCEKNDLASGTSSASTKLIHGGLRYLEHYHFKLVREALNEREILLQKAPHLISPLRFIIPYDSSGRPRWLIRLGLWIYDHLGCRSKIPGSESLNFQKNPIYQTPLSSRLTTGFAYSDCWVDDARLVVANALGAAEHGALIKNYCDVKSYEVHNGLWKVRVENKIRNTIETYSARAIVNATGPWVDSVRLVRGSHIVVPKQYQGEHAYLIQHPDKRVIFVIPYENDFTLIGTTEVDTQSPPETAVISLEEQDYLIELYNQYFKQPINQEDIVWTYSGVRPLIDQKITQSSALSRDYSFEVKKLDGAAILTVLGGKLTTYRTLSQAAVNQLSHYLPIASPQSQAASPLPGAFSPAYTFSSFVDSLKETYPWLPETLVLRWAKQYGTRIHKLIGRATAIDDLGQFFGAGCYELELRYLIEQEWARTTQDCLYRRTKLGLHLKPAEIEKINVWLEEILALSWPMALNIKDDVMKNLLVPLALASSLFALPASAGELIIGATGFNGSVSADFTQKLTDSTGTLSIAETGQDSQLAGGLYMGYIWNVNSGFNIGFEGYYDLLDLTVTQSVSADEPLEDKITGIGGLRMMPGFKITNNTQIYLELGWAYVTQEFSNPNPVKESVTDNTSAFRYGAGLQTMIYDNISLRVYYSVIDEIAEATLSDTGSGKLTATPTISEFGVGVAYHFKV